MKELIIKQELTAAGMVTDGYREVGDCFQEWEFQPESWCCMKEAFRILRNYDFYEIRIDIPEGEKVTASRVLY